MSQAHRALARRCGEDSCVAEHRERLTLGPAERGWFGRRFSQALCDPSLLLADECFDLGKRDVARRARLDLPTVDDNADGAAARANESVVQHASRQHDAARRAGFRRGRFRLELQRELG